MSFRTIENLKFDNLALRALPLDPRKENYPRDVKDACFSIIAPTPVANPQTVVWSPSALKLLELDENEVNRPDFSEYFSGNKIIPGSQPAAHCYCGHQFGYFSGQLGDGATMYLGEVITSKDERWEIQFKGAGKTPYSRTADGRKVLRSSLREFLCSEAMNFLGVPTTRAGTTVTSDTYTDRDIYYTGDVIKERCTIILRIAKSFIRFGSFEIFKDVDQFTGRKGPSVGNVKLLSDLTNYCIDTFYPEISELFPKVEDEVGNAKRYSEFFFEIVRRTARLVAEWQCVGFCHGVLNTDNMSILGVTIDYGPFGFMEYFDRDFICNSSDENGRYSYENQPEMCLWNCVKLSEALAPLVKIDKRRITQAYNDEYSASYNAKLMRKFGFFKRLDGDELIIDSFMEAISTSSADWTNVFRSFVHLKIDRKNDNKDEILDYILSQCIPIDQLLEKSKPHIPDANLIPLHQFAQTQPMILQRMGVDPALIFTEWKKREKFLSLSKLSSENITKRNEEIWRNWITNYVDRVRKELENIVDEEAHWFSNRSKMLKENNPKYILRNWIAQKAIDEAEDGNFEEARRVLQVLSDPYGLNDIDDSLLSDDKRENVGECGSCVATQSLCAPALKGIRVT